MPLTEEEKRKIEEEERYRDELKVAKTSNDPIYQKKSSVWSWFFGILSLLLAFGILFSNFIYSLLFFLISAVLLPPSVEIIENKTKVKLTKGLKTGIIVIATCLFWYFIISDIWKYSDSSENREVNTTQNQSSSVQKYPKEVNEIEINNTKIKIGDSADSVFEVITDEYKVDSPTIENNKITHHFLDGKTMFDMTFERNETGDYYVLTKIVIKDENYQISTVQEQPPIQYQAGHTSGFLATVSIPTGTTRDQLIELLNYFHSLHQKGKLSEVMKGHTVINIFDDEKWTTKENYDSITWDGTYCNYIKASYSVGLDAVERASIGGDGCPNYEEIKF